MRMRELPENRNMRMEHNKDQQLFARNYFLPRFIYPFQIKYQQNESVIRSAFSIYSIEKHYTDTSAL